MRASRLALALFAPVLLACALAGYVWFDNAYRSAETICMSGVGAGSVGIRRDASTMRIWCEDLHGNWYVGWSGTGYLIAAAAVTLLVAVVAAIIVIRRTRSVRSCSLAPNISIRGARIYPSCALPLDPASHAP